MGKTGKMNKIDLKAKTITPVKLNGQTRHIDKQDQ